ncbi:MAG: HEAT repeat domain-containing protein [Kofleriaceae bacterium]
MSTSAPSSGDRRRPRQVRRARVAFAACVVALLAFAATATAQTSARVSSAPTRGTSASSATAAEDKVAQLSELVTRSSSNHKTKLSAIAALGRLGDRRAVRPLVAALTDSNATVRALAAAALGKLGQKSALPALRQASADESPTVRTRVAEAIRSISKANNLATRDSSVAGFGREARTTQANPDLYVVVKSCNDDSPGKSSRKVRASHGEILRGAMMNELHAAPLVTSAANDAKRLRLQPRLVDVSVTKLRVRTKGAMLELETELRLAISDDNGKMLSFLTGGAKVSVPRRGFNWSYLPNLRKEALENAVRGLFSKLITHLRSTVAA